MKILNYQPFDGEINKRLKEQKESFKIKDRKLNINAVNFSDLQHNYMLDEMIDYVENEIVFSCCYYLTLVKLNKTERVLNYNAENAIIRLASFWEHLYQILNTYLYLNFTPTKIIRFDEKDDSWILGKANEKFKKINYIEEMETFLNRGLVNKMLRTRFKPDSIVSKIVKLSESDNSTFIRNLRNEIVHHKYLSQKMVTNFVDKSNILTSYNNNSVDHKEISEKVSGNLSDIIQSLELAIELFRSGVSPVKQSTRKEKFKLIVIYCQVEQKNMVIPELFIKEAKKIRGTFKLVFCPNCLSDKVNITKDKQEISELKYEEHRAHYFNLIPKYIEKRIGQN